MKNISLRNPNKRPSFEIPLALFTTKGGYVFRLMKIQSQKWIFEYRLQKSSSLVTLIRLHEDFCYKLD